MGKTIDVNRLSFGHRSGLSGKASKTGFFQHAVATYLKLLSHTNVKHRQNKLSQMFPNIREWYVQKIHNTLWLSFTWKEQPCQEWSEELSSQQDAEKSLHMSIKVWKYTCGRSTICVCAKSSIMTIDKLKCRMYFWSPYQVFRESRRLQNYYMKALSCIVCFWDIGV